MILCSNQKPFSIEPRFLSKPGSSRRRRRGSSANSGTMLWARPTSFSVNFMLFLTLFTANTLFTRQIENPKRFPCIDKQCCFGARFPFFGFLVLCAVLGGIKSFKSLTPTERTQSLLNGFYVARNIGVNNHTNAHWLWLGGLLKSWNEILSIFMGAWWDCTRSFFTGGLNVRIKMQPRKIVVQLCSIFKLPQRRIR